MVGLSAPQSDSAIAPIQPVGIHSVLMATRLSGILANYCGRPKCAVSTRGTDRGHRLNADALCLRFPVHATTDSCGEIRIL